jgi:hypothetical protein
VEDDPCTGTCVVGALLELLALPALLAFPELPALLDGGWP